MKPRSLSARSLAIASLLLFVVLGAACAGNKSSARPTASPTPNVIGGKPTTLAVDADSTTPDVVETSARRAVGTPFVIGINFVTGLNDEQPFAGVEIQIAPSNTSILTLDTETDPNGLRVVAGVPLGCGPARFVATGPKGNTHLTCTADAGTVRHTGQAWLVNAMCVAKGTVHLHLVRGNGATTGGDDADEDPTMGTQIYLTALSWVPANLQDAEVVCE